MNKNFLHLTSDKTEFIMIDPESFASLVSPIGPHATNIEPKNVGIYFD